MADQRFSALATDPRYRLPSRKEARTAVDPRFKRLFSDKDFDNKAKVDRYGRKTKSGTNKKNLEKLYQLDQEDEVAPPKASKKKPAVVEREVVGSSEDESEGDNEEEETKAATRDVAREGFSESSSEEDSSEEESEEEAELADLTAGQEQTEDIPMGEVTRRIAAVNLDWDNIRAQDLLAVAQSFAPPSGKVQRVVIYPSEFGRERLQREELEGPPKEIFADKRTATTADVGSDDEEDSEDETARIKQQLVAEQTKNDNADSDFDTAALRQYQLERLRYYYAVITTDAKPTAKALYDAMDGREYLTTANFFDLRFIPDDTSFDDDEPREECSKLPAGYKPNDFKTEALTHSKVRLTWDDDDTTRKEVQKRAFSRAEMDENDLQAYIGSGSDSDDSTKSNAVDKKATKQQQQREKMRGLLGLGAESKGRREKDEPVGDMQVTFSSGLSKRDGEKGGVFENQPQDEVSTRERYIQKERERKQKRKEKMKAARSGGEDGAEDAAEGAEEVVDGDNAEGEDDDPFNDPFFTNPALAADQEKAARKAENQAKREAKAADAAAAEGRKAELELLMAGDKDDEMKHFNMKEIQKAEKEARKKGKKGKKGKKSEEQVAEEKDAQEFEVDAGDERFKALFESHEFAIDPTNARFKGTEGMKALLEEGRKKRKDQPEGDEEIVERQGKKAKKAGKYGDDEIDGLLTRLKGKGKGKRQ